MTVKDNTFIAGLRHAWVWVVLAMITLASCRDAKEDRIEANVTLYPAIARNMETVIDTRATVTVTGATEGTTYEDNPTLNGLADGITIMAYATPTESGYLTAEHQLAGTFRYSGNRWSSSVTATTNHNYNLYAITPTTLPGATNLTFNWGVANSSFSANTVALTFSGLDLVTFSDPMISIAATGKHVVIDNGVEKEVVTEATQSQPAVLRNLTAPTLTKGSYSLGKVIMPIAGDETEMFKVWMAMDHLYAKATVYISVDAKYNNVRTIRLKSAKIVFDKGERHISGNHSYSFATSTLNFASGAQIGAGSEDRDLEIDLMRGTTAVDNFDDDPNYVILTPPEGEVVGEEVYKDFAWFCFLPQSSLPQGETFPDARLVVQYDVYDKEEHLVRADQTAQNIISLSEFYREDFVDYIPKPGDHVKIKILVKPSFLYKLIDDDATMELEIQELQ